MHEYKIKEEIISKLGNENNYGFLKILETLLEIEKKKSERQIIQYPYQQYFQQPPINYFQGNVPYQQNQNYQNPSFINHNNNIQNNNIQNNNIQNNQL